MQQPESFVVFESVQLQIDTSRSDDDAREVQDRPLVRAGSDLWYIGTINVRCEPEKPGLRFMRKINLKRSFLLLVLGLPLPMVLGAVDALPKPFTFARYQPMMDRSPFAVATAVAAPVAAPNFAKDLYVANAARVEGRGFGDDRFQHRQDLQEISDDRCAGGRIQHHQHRMVRKSRRHQGHDREGWPNGDARF